MSGVLRLPQAPPDESTGSAPTICSVKPSAQSIAKIAQEKMDFFRNQDGIPVAEIDVGEHAENVSVTSGEFDLRLRRMVYEATGQACPRQALVDARDTLAAQALFDGQEVQTYVRVARRGDVAFVDLTDPEWAVAKVTAEGWTVERSRDVCFLRNPSARPLPRPVEGGSIQQLRPFLNLSSDDDSRLHVAFMVHALLGQAPFPILTWQGQKGAAKSTATRFTKALVDPARGGLRALPRGERDLSIAASLSYVLAYDNLSGLSTRMADALCRLSTGAAFATRQLYTNGDEHVLEYVRPSILNGIDDILRRADLADRSLLLTLEEIPPNRRKPEEELNSEFERVRPAIFGALLSLVAGALRQLPNVQLTEHPRMADFARTGVAVERAAGWPEDSFLRAFQENKRKTIEAELGSDPVVDGVKALVKSSPYCWQGTATELLQYLSEVIAPALRQGPEWPHGARALSDRIRRLETALRHVGIAVQYKRTSQARTIHISRKQGEEPGEARND